MRRLAMVALVLVGLVACGSDDEGGGATTDTSDATATSEAAAAPVELSGKVNDEGAEDATGEDTLEVEADDFYFKPTFIKVSEGQKLTIELKNEGQAKHTFTSTALNVDTELAAGATASVEVTVPDGEAFLFFCRFHQGGGMQGAFYAKEGAKVGATPSGGASGY
jgi:plastocyanin